MNAHNFSFETLKGETLFLGDFANKVVMIVNTASECGFTKQYKALEELYQTYKDKGFILIGAPSNDFGGQEPGKMEDIQKTCDFYQVHFPIAQKVSIKGDQAHPFYQWVRAQVGILGYPKWNFHKILIGKDGHLIDWFSSPTSPLNPKIKRKIEEALL